MLALPICFLHLKTEVPEIMGQNSTRNARNFGHKKLGAVQEESLSFLISQCNSQNTYPDPVGGVGKNPAEINRAFYLPPIFIFQTKLFSLILFKSSSGLWPHRQVVKPQAFHACIVGSNPAGVRDTYFIAFTWRILFKLK